MFHVSKKFTSLQIHSLLLLFFYSIEIYDRTKGLFFKKVFYMFCTGVCLNVNSFTFFFVSFVSYFWTMLSLYINTFIIYPLTFFLHEREKIKTFVTFVAFEKMWENWKIGFWLEKNDIGIACWERRKKSAGKVVEGGAKRKSICKFIRLIKT